MPHGEKEKVETEEYYDILSAKGNGLDLATNVGLPANGDAQLELIAAVLATVEHVSEKLAESGHGCGHKRCMMVNIAELALSRALKMGEPGQAPDRGCIH